MEKLVIEINYGGAFVGEDTVRYVGGQQDIIDNLDADKLSMFEIGDLLGQLGVTKWMKLHYCEPHLELNTGLRGLSSDTDVLAMISSIDDKRYVKIYVEGEIQVDDVERDCAIGGDDMDDSINADGNVEMWPEYTSTTTDVVVGMTFTSLKKIKDLVSNQALSTGHNVKFFKNEKTRLTAKCRYDDCKWKLHASKMHNEATFQIKRYDNVHTCPRIMQNTHATVKWVANTYRERFRSQPDWKITSIIDTVRQQYSIDFNPSLCYQARRMAKQLNDGCGDEQYTQLWSYREEILRTNPGSTFVIELEERTFQRAYVCFHAWKQGLLTGGRPVICLDGCHLKGQCPGHLLTAVGVDGNDGTYPIAIAVVESECIDSWNWFLVILLRDLGIEGGAGWTFISDQQKGLTDSLDRLVPRAEIRFCVRHLYAKFKNKFCGLVYKDAMMKASRKR